MSGWLFDINKEQTAFTGDVRFIGDVCEKRHRRNAESIAAVSKVDKSQGQQDVLDVLTKWGPRCSKEIARFLSKSLHTVTPRISELKAMGKIRATGERKEGCAVLTKI